MLKISLRYTNFGEKDKCIEVIVYDSEPFKDNVHLSASFIINANAFKKLSKSAISNILMSLEGAYETCAKSVLDRKDIKV